MFVGKKRGKLIGSFDGVDLIKLFIEWQKFFKYFVIFVNLLLDTLPSI